ncbi:transposase, partial [Klebsiella pneumoniae]|uniref:transposase n=1 Tax=Klebsiella pneumoniae TaxID=573 RepID=UPI003EF85309
RRIYKIGLVVFIFTSLACALSRSLEMLTFARVAQGLGTISTEIGDGKQYASSRDFAAATGLVPRQYSTGGRTT